MYEQFCIATSTSQSTFAACSAALLCAALCYANNCQHLSLGWRWQNFIWFSAVAGSGGQRGVTVCSVSLHLLSLIFPSLSLSYLPPLPFHALFLQLALCRAAFWPARSVCLVFGCLPLSVCAQHKCCQLFTHTDAPRHTHLLHTPTIALAFAQCRRANSEPRHITKFRTVCNCNAANVAVAVAVAVDAASSITANVPKKAWRVQNANGRASCPIDSWPRGAGRGRRREGGKREVAGIECRLTGHICG